MAFKRFRINIIARVLLLCITLFFLNLTILRHLYTASALFIIIIISQVFSLASYLETTNRRLTRLFESIKYGDFSASFSTDIKGSSFSELNDAFNKVIERFRDLSREKEEHHRYLQSVVQHVGIGVIAFRQSGQVELINSAAKNLFDIPRLNNIESLSGVSPELARAMSDIEPGGSRLVKAAAGGNLLHLFILATELRLQRATLKLVTIQNIKAELDAREMEAWQNLIRVLTHEIKNSLTPISSLAASVGDMIAQPSGDNAPDIELALKTIKKRSDGLLRFTDAYRSLTKIRNPEFKRFPISELAERVEKLNGPGISKEGITLSVSIDPPGLELTADPQLTEQVLINLVLNAAEALEGKTGGKIEIKAFVDDRNRVVIQVADNGRGITDDAGEKIFIPFFSTKKDGSGIGLSVSRQIMRLHKGDLTAESEPGRPTVFSMCF